MKIEIIRVENTDKATRGVILINDKCIGVTLELPWKNNEDNISCIPEGIYDFERTSTPHHKDTILINGVPNREAILIHVGNTTKDTEGCILVGCGYGIDEEPAILESRIALANVLNTIGKNGKGKIILRKV